MADKTASTSTGDEQRVKTNISPKSRKKSRDHGSNVNEDADSATHDSDDDSDGKPSAPMQKRRRVTRACDECRRKKIKCDGKQPCTHCTVYSYECTYDQPSNRRRNPAPQYIEALEQRLQKAEIILRSVLPGYDFDDPKFDAHGVDQILRSTKPASSSVLQRQQKAEDDAQMRSMVGRTGSLDLDDTGRWDYHGHSSGYMFMNKFRAQFGDSFLPAPPPRHFENKTLSHVVDSPLSIQSSPFDANGVLNPDLPPREVAIDLCRNAIDDACALTRPIHRPSFFKQLHSLYETDSEQYTNDHIKFLPLLYIVMALGCLFPRCDDESNPLHSKDYKDAIEHGYQYFNMGKSMLDITDCRDIITLQAVVFMIFFLQGTAKLATCYAYVGIALRACCRLGMHRKITAKFDPIEQEERKRIFWLVRKMDGYVGAMLGLPQMLSDDDVDQELPTEVHDECITKDGIQPMPSDSFPLMKATNAHTRLLFIMRKAVRYIYPVKPTGCAQPGENYTISHSLIRELERDLQSWMDELPLELRPSDVASIELSRAQQLLRMSYAYVQMMIYRPFLHYVAHISQGGKADKRSFACAAACVSVARNIVHITTEMRRRGLLIGAYWFVMYTTYFAILSLVYFVLENPESATSREILKDAMEGRDTLAGLAKRSMAADRCTSSLATLFEELPEKLKERRNSTQVPTTSAKKRGPPFSEQNLSTAGATTSANAFSTSARSRTLPMDYLAKLAKRNSMPDPNAVPTILPFTATGTPPISNLGFSTPSTGTPNMGQLDFGSPAGQLPDLKNVMFPGDNPFAYPNQPMSTLEDNQFSGLLDSSLGGDGMLDVSGVSSAGDFDGSGFSSSFGPPFNQQGQQQFNGTVSNNTTTNSHPFFGLSGDMMDENQAQSRGGLQVPGAGQEEDYWSHAPGKGQFRTGLTPGGPTVNLNLDDLFGNGQNWSGVGLGMGMGMGIGTGVGSDEQMNMNVWPGGNSSNTNWQP